jgi:hypothetical protein
MPSVDFLPDFPIARLSRAIRSGHVAYPYLA